MEQVESYLSTCLEYVCDFTHKNVTAVINKGYNRDKKLRIIDREICIKFKDIYHEFSQLPE